MANISFRSLGGRRPTQGFTLTEIAIVLGIVGIIIGAIWVAAAMLYENNRTNEASMEVLTIVNNWRSIYGGKRMDIPDWTDVTPVTINNGFMPQEMVVPGVNTYSLGPWTSSTAHVFSSQTYNGIIVGYFHLTVSACNHLANAVAGQNSGIIWEDINGVIRVFPPGGTDAYFTPADISGVCVDPNQNFIWVIYPLS